MYGGFALLPHSLLASVIIGRDNNKPLKGWEMAIDGPPPQALSALSPLSAN